MKQCSNSLCQWQKDFFHTLIIAMRESSRFSKAFAVYCLEMGWAHFPLQPHQGFLITSVYGNSIVVFLLLVIWLHRSHVTDPTALLLALIICCHRRAPPSQPRGSSVISQRTHNPSLFPLQLELQWPTGHPTEGTAQYHTYLHSPHYPVHSRDACATLWLMSVS